MGKDKHGEEIIDKLSDKGISTEYIQVDPDKKTGTVTVTLDENAIPSFKCSTGSAFEFIDWSEKFEKLVDLTDAFLFGTLAQINSHSRKTLHKLIAKLKNSVIVYDINLRGWPGETKKLIEKSLYRCHLLKLNYEEFLKLKDIFNVRYKEDISSLKKIMDNFNIKLISLSLGAEGCLILNRDKVVHSPGVKVKPIDTTGAGDAFIAGTIVKFLENASLEEIAEFSNLLGAFITTQKGATPEYNPEVINKFKMKLNT